MDSSITCFVCSSNLLYPIPLLPVGIPHECGGFLFLYGLITALPAPFILLLRYSSSLSLNINKTYYYKNLHKK